MWQRCAIGQTWTGASCSGSPSKITWDSATKQTSTLAGFNDWRLPTPNELETIVEYKNVSPAINTTVFPNATSDYFWSSSVYNNQSDLAWILNFNKMYEYYGDKHCCDHYAVRLVRGTWTAPTEIKPEVLNVDLSVAITKPTAVVTTNKKATYKITVTNNSEFTATGVKAYFVVPGKTLVTVDIPKNCTANGRIIECSLADLAAKKTVTQSFPMTVWKKGALNVAATTISVEDDANLDNNEASAVISVK